MKRVPKRRGCNDSVRTESLQELLEMPSAMAADLSAENEVTVISGFSAPC